MTATSQQASTSWLQSWLSKYGPGLALCVALAVVAYSIQEVEKRLIDNAVIDALVIALVAGIAVRNMAGMPKSLDAGAKYASKQVLEASIFLLGASVVFGQIVDAGLTLFLLITFSVVGGLTFAWTVGHLLLGLRSKLAVLVGVGGSICGNSAVAAVAPAIGATADDVAAAIGISAVLGVGQILLLPLLVPGLDLTHYQYGIVAGIAVYAVPQVVAASFAVSNLSGQVATLVKLVRVLFLGPMIIVLGLMHRGTVEQPAGKSALQRVQGFVPWFVAGFVVLAILRSTEVISPGLGSDANTLSKWLFIVAMAGLGLGVDLKNVAAVGPRVALTVLGTMAFMILTGLVGTSLFDLVG